MASTDRLLGAGKPLPRVEGVRAMEDRILEIVWDGGTKSLVDLRRHIAIHAVFARLRSDDTYFRDVKISDWGWAIHWDPSECDAIPSLVLDQLVLR